MAKLNLSTITSGYATVDALNANFDAIETAFENTLSRDGTAPNPMGANIDMDSNRIINAADGVNSTDVPTLRQLTALIAAANLENVVVLTETQTATAGQTVFNLAGLTYSPGANNLSIFVNGLRLHPDDYTETDENTVTMASGLADGDDVFFLTNEELLITDTVNITGGHINAAVIGNTTPAAGTFTNLTATGNTVLGDATTDTVAIAGAVGIKTTPVTYADLLISGDGSGDGSARYIAEFTGRALSNMSSTMVGVRSRPRTLSNPTIPTVTSIQAFLDGITAGTTVTTLTGLHVNAPGSPGTTTYGVRSTIASGTNQYNIYADGTANNAFAGNVRIGSTVAPTVALDVTGAAAISNGLAVTGAISATTTASIGTTANDSTIKLLVIGTAKAIRLGTTPTNAAIEGVDPTGSGSYQPLSVGGSNVSITASGAQIGLFTSTGLEVTGALSCSTNLTVTGGTITTGSTTALSLATSGGVNSTFINIASAVNYLEHRAAATSGAPGIAARGSDTNINLSFDTKGTGSHVFTTGTLAATQAVIQHRASADLYLTLTGGQTGVVNPTIGVSGGALTISCALVLSQTTLLQTSVALTNGAGAATGTLTNAPTAGNPTKWIPINDNGTTRYIPAW